MNFCLFLPCYLFGWKMSVSYYGDSPRDDTTFVQNCQSAPFFVQLYVFVFRTIFFNKKDELNKTIYQLPHHKKI